MAGLPTVTVKLDDGTGTFPYDISTYVRLADEVTITVGRTDEFGEVQPSTASLTLENSDGRFTLGSTSGGYGAIDIDRPIRISLTINAVTTKRFTGYVQAWPTEWPDGGDTFAVAKITAVDRLARLSRRDLQSVIQQEILADAPTHYYTLGEATGAVTAGDTSGNGATTLSMAGTGTAVVFGDATGPGTDGLTAATFAGGKYLVPAETFPSAGAPVTHEVFFNTTSTSVGMLWFVGDGGLNIVAGKVEAASSGALGAPKVTSAATYNDGLTHHAAVTVDAAGNAELFVDGPSVDTNSGFTSDVRVKAIGNGGSDALTPISPFTGVIAHAASFDSILTGTRIAAHAAAGLTGFDAERSDERIARYAGYANIASGDLALETGVQADVPHLDITGMSVLAATAKVMQAEGGLLFVDGDGDLVMQNREHRALQGSADLTLTTNDLSPGSVISADMQLVRNFVTASAGSNGAIQVAKNAASITAHEVYPDDMSGLLVPTDEEALQAARWRVTAYAEPAARLSSFPLDLLTLTNAQAASAQALRLSDRVKITGLPAQALAGTTTADLILEGWTETLTATSWDMTFNTSSFAQVAAWLLDNTTYSVLGTSTRLSY